MSRPLYDDAVGGKCRNVEIGKVVDRGGFDGVLDGASHDVEATFERVLVEAVAPHKALHDAREYGARSPPDGRGVVWDVAPAEQREPFLGGRHVPACRCRCVVGRRFGARTPYRRRTHPKGADRCRVTGLRRGNRASGRSIRMPAPSPVSGSAPIAPRCSRFSRISMAWSTMVWLGSPLRLATTPTPQASCSNRRVVKPLFGAELWIPVRWRHGVIRALRCREAVVSSGLAAGDCCAPNRRGPSGLSDEGATTPHAAAARA